MLEVNELTPLAQLGQALSFSMEDLRANRNKRLTRRQRRRVWRRFLSAILTGLMLLLAPIVVSWILVLWGTDQSWSQAVVDPAALVGYLTGGLLASFYGIVQYNTLLLVVDTMRGHVRAVSGPVRRYGRYLYLNQQRFLLNASTLDLIQNDLHYTFYILPGSHHVLSVEFAE